MCAVGLYLLAAAACIVIPAICVAFIAGPFLISLFLSCSVWWMGNFMYRMLRPGEPAFQVLQPSAPELRLLAAEAVSANMCNLSGILDPHQKR